MTAKKLGFLAWLAGVGLLAPVIPSPGSAAERTSGPALTTPAEHDFRAKQRETAYYPNAQEGMIASAAATANELLGAMDVDPAILINPTLTAEPRGVAVFPGLGSLQPGMGSNFAWMSSGVAGAGTPQTVDPSATGTQSGTGLGGTCPSGGGYDCAILSFSFQVPSGMNSLRFNFNFMSAEYPEFVGTSYNDQFIVKLTSPSYSYPNIVFDMNGNDVTINSAFFNQSCNSLTGTGFDIYGFNGNCDAGATGLLTTAAPIAPGETVTLEFSVRDMGDSIYDSAVMLDNFILSPETVTGPTTGGGVKVNSLSPKSGPVAGGTQVQIHGEDFINVESVAFDNVPAVFQVLDQYTIVAVSPPSSQGPVNVAVTAAPNNVVSTGVATNGFTYYVHPEGAPLAVVSVDPPEGPSQGGVAVTVRGSGFDLNSVVTFDGEPVAASQFINGDEIVVTTPPGRNDAEVRVTNPDGSTDALAGGYLYVGSGSSANGASGGVGGCSCSIDAGERSGASPLALGAFGLLVAAWVVRRRGLGFRKESLARLAIVLPAVLVTTACNDQTLAPVNSAPIANAGPSGEAFAGETIELDGSNSYDFEDGDNIVYAWEIVTRPDGSNAVLDDPTAVRPTFVADASGLFRVGLVVTDTDENQSGDIGYGGRDDDNLTDIVVVPYRELRATLTWDTDASDLDLHMIRSATQGPNVTGYWSPTTDCFYGVPDPEWGSVGVLADNPLLEQDVDTGFGPEIVALPSPQDPGKYDIVVHVYNAHGAGATNATVNVELNGATLATVTSATSLGGTDSVWVVGNVTWPDGTFNEVNMMTTHSALGGAPH